MELTLIAKEVLIELQDYKMQDILVDRDILLECYDHATEEVKLDRDHLCLRLRDLSNQHLICFTQRIEHPNSE